MMHSGVLIAILGVLAAVPAVSRAEGDEGKPAAVVHKVKPKALAPKPQPVKTPAAPIPYTTYSGITPDATPEVAKALTPEVAPAAAHEAPPPVVVAVLPTDPVPVPPAPVVVAPVETVAAPSAPSGPPEQVEIVLRCDTRTTKGKHLVSSGTFYIDLFPSAVFPDQVASFKFLFADPNHNSLIRDTICLDTLCPAQVSGTAYYLVNRVTKKGAALRITLDRVKGAFYAEEIEKGMLVGGSHLGEQGYCTPQPLPDVRF